MLGRRHLPSRRVASRRGALRCAAECELGADVGADVGARGPSRWRGGGGGGGRPRVLCARVRVRVNDSTASLDVDVALVARTSVLVSTVGAASRAVRMFAAPTGRNIRAYARAWGLLARAHVRVPSDVGATLVWCGVVWCSRAPPSANVKAERARRVRF